MEALPSFDLVVGTVGRVRELRALLASLAAQTHPAARILIVDQSAGHRMREHYNSETALLPIEWLRAEPGLSRARNVALERVTADVVAFPDDDCTYPPDLLERAARALTTRTGVDLLTGRTAEGGRASPRWHSGGVVRVRDVWHAGNSASMFVRRRLLERIGPFDERLGLGSGTPWSSTEDVELIVRALLAGARVEHDPSLVVEHPLRQPLPGQLSALGARDGGGVGFVLGLHGLGARIQARMFVRPLGGAALALARLDGPAARFHMKTWRARVRGYRAGRRARATSSSKSAA